MLAVPADRLPTALADLDPGNRALLDLSLRRGVSDAEIGELLRKDPDEVSRGRDAVLELLADALELDGYDRRERVRRAVMELPDEAWTGTRRASAPVPEAPIREEVVEAPREDFDEPEGERESLDGDFDEPRREPEAGEEPERSVPEPEADEAERDRESADRDRADGEAPFAREVGPRDDVFLPPARERSSRRGLLIGLAGLLIVLAVVGALVLGGGDDDEGEPAPSGDQEQSNPPSQNAGKGVAFKAIGGGEGSGEFTARGDGRFVLVLKDLPAPSGAYQVWLYNSVVDSVPLGTFRTGSGRVTIRLPQNAKDYRFLDISQEPADSNRNHSGDSVLRARLKPLLEQ